VKVANPFSLIREKHIQKVNEYFLLRSQYDIEQTLFMLYYRELINSQWLRDNNYLTVAKLLN